MPIRAPYRALFAAAAACLAILSIIYHDFAPLWQFIPNSVWGHETWVYGSAFVLLAAAAGLCFTRTALAGILAIGAYFIFWGVGSAPPIFSDPLSFGSWYGVCEAASSLAGAWIICATVRQQPRGLHAARAVFGLTCIFYGCSHFAFAEFTASFVPAWLPYRLGFAYFTGLCHITGGLGIFLGILPRLAANLEALMMSLFGLLVWVPSFFAVPRPSWAGTPQNQWSEIVVNLVLAAAAWVIADSLRSLPWRLSPLIARLNRSARL
jgi:uncharacterized membrane protein